MDTREPPEKPFFHPIDQELYGRKAPLLFVSTPVDPENWLREAIASGGIIDRGSDFREKGHWCRYAYR